MLHSQSEQAENKAKTFYHGFACYLVLLVVNNSIWKKKQVFVIW